MKYFISSAVGYLLGCVNPAAIISKIKKRDLRKLGTKNLGTTNAVMNFGKRLGFIVFAVDVSKAYLAFLLARIFFSDDIIARFIAGSCAVVGHCFPVFLKFKGGKGLASFAGFVLAADPLVFALLLLFGVLLVVTVNYGFVLPLSSAALFPLLIFQKTGSVGAWLISTACACVIIAKHGENIRLAITGQDIRVREYLKKYVFSRKNGE